MTIGLDTSVLVALLATEASNHFVTRSCYEHHRIEAAEFVIPDHALIETFSVLTRAPRPLGRPAPLVYYALRSHFHEARIVGVSAWDAIAHTVGRGFWGGRVHDAEIALASYQAGAEVLLTWNVRHFQTVAPEGLRVRTPEHLVT